MFAYDELVYMVALHPNVHTYGILKSNIVTHRLVPERKPEIIQHASSAFNIQSPSRPRSLQVFALRHSRQVEP